MSVPTIAAETPMRMAIERYLAERRRLGFALKSPGGILLGFARFADAREHRGPLTLELQLDWANTRKKTSLTAAGRLTVLRPFAKHYRQFEPDSVVAEPMLCGRTRRRLTPHIYTALELAALLDEATRLPPAGGLRPLTYQTLFGLIAAAGLRLSEAVHLRDADVDLTGPDVAAVTVRLTKFSKSRHLPIHASTAAALVRYRHARDRVVAPVLDRSFFVSEMGRALPLRTVHGVFEDLRRRLGWVARGGHPHPRIHDLRHTFAVRRMQSWLDAGVTADHGMFLLSTYLGHAGISDTYWYLTGVPDLMGTVSQRFERYALGPAAVDHE